jgi:hypothetical protein
MRWLLLSSLAAAAVAQTVVTSAGTCKVFPKSDEGCNLSPVGCSCPGPLFSCDAGGGQCASVLGVKVCAGTCKPSTLGYAIFIGVPLLVVALLVCCCCCCCACCSRGAARERTTTSTIYIANPAADTYGALSGGPGPREWERGAQRGGPRVYFS